MHSGRMRTARFSGHLGGGGLSRGEVCLEGSAWGVFAYGVLPGGCIGGAFANLSKRNMKSKIFLLIGDA